MSKIQPHTEYVHASLLHAHQRYKVKPTVAWMGWWETPLHTMKGGCPTALRRCSFYAQNPGDSTWKLHSEHKHTSISYEKSNWRQYPNTNILQFNTEKGKITSSLKCVTIIVVVLFNRKNYSCEVDKKPTTYAQCPSKSRPWLFLHIGSMNFL